MQNCQSYNISNLEQTAQENFWDSLSEKYTSFGFDQNHYEEAQFTNWLQLWKNFLWRIELDTCNISSSFVRIVMASYNRWKNLWSFYSLDVISQFPKDLLTSESIQKEVHRKFKISSVGHCVFSRILNYYNLILIGCSWVTCVLVILFKIFFGISFFIKYTQFGKSLSNGIC